MPLPPRRSGPPSGSGGSGDDPLAALVDLPGVCAGVERARTACEELRWHEAFRRRWREVRAEADLRAARASAAVDGARVPLAVVRGLATGAGGDVTGAGSVGVNAEADTASLPSVGQADLTVVAGALRATSLAATWRPDLGGRGDRPLPPLGQMLARLHAAAGRGWLPDDALGRVRGDEPPRDLTGLGPAPIGQVAADRIALLSDTVAGTGAPALVVAAVVHGELVAIRPFVAGNGVVARALSRLMLTTRGLDPTGSVLAEAGWAQNPNPYLAAAAQFSTGEPSGVAVWLCAYAEAVVDGVEQARRVADGVLAGRIPE